jgi:hypothetical protein
MRNHRTAPALGALALLCGCVYGQTTTGTLLGTGIFRFNSLEPAIYNLVIRPSSGFKTYEQANVEIIASEVRDLGRISLALGQITEQAGHGRDHHCADRLGRKLQAGGSRPDDEHYLEGARSLRMLSTIPGVQTTQQDTTWAATPRR